VCKKYFTILIANKVGYESNSKKKSFLILNVNFGKVYDSSLRVSLLHYENNEWIKWINFCINSTRMWISMNGIPLQKFSISKRF